MCSFAFYLIKTTEIYPIDPKMIEMNTIKEIRTRSRFSCHAALKPSSFHRHSQATPVQRSALNAATACPCALLEYWAAETRAMRTTKAVNRERHIATVSAIDSGLTILCSILMVH